MDKFSNGRSISQSKTAVVAESSSATVAIVAHLSPSTYLPFVYVNAQLEGVKGAARSVEGKVAKRENPAENRDSLSLCE